MGYVHPDRPDLFVSYAHADDQLDPVQKDQWVSKLVGALEIRLKERLSDDLAIWRDRAALAGNEPVSDALDRDVGRSATLLVVLSPRYLGSEWTKREREVFQKVVAERHGDLSRVFIVERFKIDHDRRPAELGNRVGYRFWTAVEDDSRPLDAERDRDAYSEQLDDLVRDLVRKLKELQRAASAATVEATATAAAAPVPPPADGPDGRPAAVYLAEVTIDLEASRDGVRRHLEQQGLLVLPREVYPRNPAAFAEAARRDLGRAKLFVQLLGPYPERPSPDLPAGYVGLQQALAEEARTPIFQWRPGFDPAEVADADHRARLLRPTVLAEPIEEFKARVVREATAPPPTPPEPPPDVFVFVNAERSDRPFARSLSDALLRIGIDHACPEPEEGAVELSREQLEEYLEYCNAYFVVYGECPTRWADKQLLESRRIAAKRETPFEVIGVYDGPPEGKPEPSVRLRNVQLIHGYNGIDEAKLRAFFDAMRKGARP